MDEINCTLLRNKGYKLEKPNVDLNDVEKKEQSNVEELIINIHY